jgi:hypothetical protein
MTDRGADRPEAEGLDFEGHGDVVRQRLVDDDRTIGFEPHGELPPFEAPADRPERRLTIDPREEQLADPATRDPSPSSGAAADDERRDLPEAEPG